MHKNIQFNLKKALSGDPVVTRDGGSISEIHNFGVRGNEFCIAAVVDGSLVMYYTKGTRHRDPTLISPLDLFMAPPEEVAGYIAFGLDTYGCIESTDTKKTPQHANNSFKKHMGSNPLQIIRVSTTQLPEIWDMT
jgi:hypothetical protein